MMTGRGNDSRNDATKPSSSWNSGHAIGPIGSSTRTACADVAQPLDLLEDRAQPVLLLGPLDEDLELVDDRLDELPRIAAGVRGAQVIEVDLRDGEVERRRLIDREVADEGRLARAAHADVVQRPRAVVVEEAPEHGHRVGAPDEEAQVAAVADRAELALDPVARDLLGHRDGAAERAGERARCLEHLGGLAELVGLAQRQDVREQLLGRVAGAAPQELREARPLREDRRGVLERGDPAAQVREDLRGRLLRPACRRQRPGAPSPPSGRSASAPPRASGGTRRRGAGRRRRRRPARASVMSSAIPAWSTSGRA